MFAASSANLAWAVGAAPRSFTGIADAVAASKEKTAIKTATRDPMILPTRSCLHKSIGTPSCFINVPFLSGPSRAQVDVGCFDLESLCEEHVRSGELNSSPPSCEWGRYFCLFTRKLNANKRLPWPAALTLLV